jgi:hypothetical protein
VEAGAGTDSVGAIPEYSASVVEVATGAELDSAEARFFSTITELAAATDVVDGRRLWEPVDDDQNANWQAVDTAQTPNWQPVNNAQTPNWQAVTNAQTPNWQDVTNAQTPGWAPVNTL